MKGRVTHRYTHRRIALLPNGPMAVLPHRRACILHRVSCTMHTPCAGFRSVSQAFRLIALLPYCPIALPRPGYPGPGTRYRVPEWKAGSGSDKGTDDGSGESPSHPNDRLRFPESSLRDRPSFIGRPLSLIHALTYDRT